MTRVSVLALLGALLIGGNPLTGEEVPVRHVEGLLHGFLSLRSLEGSLLAYGDLEQTTSGARVTSRLVFQFKDGSLNDETTVFSERKTFRLLTDHLVQKGPSFPQPIDLSIDAVGGRVVVRYSDEHGQPKVASEHLDLPADLANGMIPTLLKNLRGGASPQTVGLLAASPKPRLVKLAIRPEGTDSFSTAGEVRKATRYVLKVEIGGIAGALAPLLGKQPPDSHVWILEGDAPAFLKAEQPLYVGGPVWRIEPVSPVWRTSSAVRPSGAASAQTP